MTRMASSFDDYQQSASTTAKYPPERGLEYCALGLASEAGEVAGKLKKAIRDEGGVISDERKAQLISELGDVLWYAAMFALELDVPLSRVVEENLAKLSDRSARGVIWGDGDKR